MTDTWPAAALPRTSQVSSRKKCEADERDGDGREGQRQRPAGRSVDNRGCAAHEIGKDGRTHVLGGEPDHRDVILRVISRAGCGVVRCDEIRDVF